MLSDLSLFFIYIFKWKWKDSYLQLCRIHIVPGVLELQMPSWYSQIISKTNKPIMRAPTHKQHHCLWGPLSIWCVIQDSWLPVSSQIAALKDVSQILSVVVVIDNTYVIGLRWRYWKNLCRADNGKFWKDHREITESTDVGMITDLKRLCMCSEKIRYGLSIIACMYSRLSTKSPARSL